MLSECVVDECGDLWPDSGLTCAAAYDAYLVAFGR